MNKKKVIRILLWAAVLGMMTVIFALSAQPGPESDELSNVVAEPVVELICIIVDGVEEAEAEQLLLSVGGVIRKIAHFLEYALLGLLLRLLCLQYDRSRVWLPILIGVLYAATDEFHQTFVPSRSGMVTDVLLDSAGVCCGVYAERIISKFRRK